MSYDLLAIFLRGLYLSLSLIGQESGKNFSVQLFSLFCRVAIDLSIYVNQDREMVQSFSEIS